ncbi:MAG: capsule biosynthesis protein [Planctomycetes bacterium]|nr:capsule biosynthesis protein [Planctomycetota bacterium]
MANNVPGFYNSTTVESLLAAALTLRGADVHVLQCDRELPACLRLKVGKTSPEMLATTSFRETICTDCAAMVRPFEELGVTVHRMSALLDDGARTRCRDVAATTPLESIPRHVLTLGDDEIPVGEHALAGALRYFAIGQLDREPQGEVVLRRYFEAALRTAHAVHRLVRDVGIDRACFHHGIYIPQGVVAEVLRARSIPFSTWNVAYRKRCFLFSHEDTYHHTLLDEPTESWETMAFDDDDERAIDAYLASRWHGSQDWIYFHDTPDPALETLVAATGIDPDRPIIGLLTNVVWDAQLHYRANAFPSMLDWIEATIRLFADRPAMRVLFRVHPAEIRGTQRSRQRAVEEIERAFPRLPANVFVVGPESSVNTYAAMERCNAVLIYGTKTGVELTSRGIPVIVAGEAWIRNKGLTIDARSRDEYRSIIAGLPLTESRLPAETVRRAKRYAYHFFFRRMIPVAAIEPLEGDAQHAPVPFRVAIESLRDLEPGRDAGLDTIVDGISSGAPFIYPAEREGIR